jgi:hypothetical protein
MNETFHNYNIVWMSAVAFNWFKSDQIYALIYMYVFLIILISFLYSIN